MSANNYTTCPRCEHQHQENLRQMAVELAEAYGKLPLEEWERMRQDHEAAKQARLEETFREDYEFHGAETGEVTASYRGTCSRCALSTSFEHKHQIEGVNDEG
ncbi:hypothetical protein ACFWNT_31850 [Streptomyces sp. NPDC058409]|uniref:hypothetical protein n=1 Tax=Streptomyces sp. NPDC058409 TaxID=3346484 RepID=UPI003648087C